MNLYIGLMSGTSMDGIDAALVDLDANTLIAGIMRPYSDNARKWLQNITESESTSPGSLSQLNTIIGREFAFAVHQLLDKAQISPADIKAIGSHGQTICHDAAAEIPYTVQVGCAHTIAELTGITVVADFRTRDLVVGGQGAPFAPIYHQAIFGGENIPLAVVNIGGIANVTYLSPESGVCGHDIGPGNCLMDAWIQQHKGLAYDEEGAWATTGKVIMPLLLMLLLDPYFKLKPPKSLGKEYFSKEWLATYLKSNYEPKDVQATLLELTARTIADEIKKSPFHPQRIALCGGGARNAALHTAIEEHLPELQIISTKMMGIDPDFLEAMMFAWLADKALHGISLDFKTITGAKNTAIYGAIYAAGVDKRISLKV